MGHVLWAGLSLAREESVVRGRERARVLRGARRLPVVGIMLRNLTIEQVNEWFTIGKDVTAVEFLGGRAQATASRDSSCLPSPFAVQESLR